MDRVQRAVRRADTFQQRHGKVGFIVAVAKKFGDDRAGDLSALIAYYGFLSLLPLMVVAVTVLGWVAQGNPALRDSILNSTLRDFPVIGPQIGSNLRALNGSGVGVVLATLLALWSGTAVVKSFGRAMDTVWDVPLKRRPNLLRSSVRALAMLAVLGIVAVAATAGAGLAAGGRGPSWIALGFAIALVLNAILFLTAFRILTVADVRWSDVSVGALVGAFGWTLMTSLGGWWLKRSLQGSTEIYGTFALVIALMGWIYLGTQLALFAAEINVVRRDRLFPRGLTQDSLTEADRRALSLYARREERRRGMSIHVDLDEQETR